jgi:GT2 family glycosyltransferase
VSDRPSVAVIIVSYNVRDELDGCLRSIDGDAFVSSSHVCVVDNGSGDGTPRMVRERWPAVRLIETGGNLGFARGTNIGIRATASELVLLLNPDTVVAPGAIRTLVERLTAAPGAAAAGPRLVDRDGCAELSFGWEIGPFGELRQKVVTALYQRRVGPVVRSVERWTRDEGPREWLSGACLLVRRADLEAVNLLDERFFMYTEDVDLCVSLRALDKTILFVPDAEVTHLGGRSGARNSQTERLRRQSQLAYYAKRHPGWVGILKAYLRATGKLVV